MASLDFAQVLLGAFSIFHIIAFIVHTFLKGSVDYESEEARQNINHGRAGSTHQASAQQNNDDSPPEDAALLDRQNVTNSNEDSSPPNPAGFLDEQFERITKQRIYFYCRMMMMFFLLGIGFNAFLQSVISPAVKESATVTTGTTVNIEGAALAKVHHSSTSEWKVWDATDIADPAVESNMFFITTARVLTKNQTLREDCVQSDVSCRDESDCVSWFGKTSGKHGIYTGACGNGACTVRAWCPQEYNTNDTNAYAEVLNGSLNFAVLIKSHMYMRFENGNEGRRDSIDKYTGSNGKNCIYDKEKDPYCPRFHLSTIVHQVTGNETATYESLVKHGGVVSIRLDWICTLRDCELTYNFTLLDRRSTSSHFKGFSSTDSEYDYNTNTRTFIRSTGIIFLVEVDGIGYRFSSIAFVIVTASSLVIVRGTDMWVELTVLLFLKYPSKAAYIVSIFYSIVLATPIIAMITVLPS